MPRHFRPEVSEAIDELMNSECPASGPGAGIAVVRDGQVVHATGYGLANVEWNQPVSPTTLFAIGSLTKQFTAAAVCMLLEEGRLDLDERLSDRLPDYAGANGNATLRQLLQHTSGIRNYGPSATEAAFRKDVRLTELLALIQSLPADFAPGERYQYGNSGYVLLGAVIERVSGVRYHEFVRSRIFEPLGMKSSCVLRDGPVRAQRASSYWYGADHVLNNAPFVSMTWPHAAGALGSTLEDLAKWDRGLRSHALLSAATSGLMHEPARLNDGNEYPYGFGIGLGTYLGRRCAHHAGGIGGFVAQIRYLYDPDLTVILLANYRTAPFDRLTRKITRLALGVTDVTRQALVPDRADLDGLAGTYVAHHQVLRVERSDTHLIATWTQGQSRRLVPCDDGFFEADDPEVEWRFDRGGLRHLAPGWPPIVYTRSNGSR